jgi:hypothetical protein
MTPIPSLRPSSPTPSHPTLQPLNRKSSIPSIPVGLLRPPILLALLEDNQKLVNMNLQPVWKFLPSVSYEKKERRPSYGSKPGSRRHSIKSLTPKPEVGTPLTEEPVPLPDEQTIPYNEIVQSLRSLELGRATPSDSRGIWAAGFEDWINESQEAFELRNEHLDRITRGWKMSNQFMDQLAGSSFRSMKPFSGLIRPLPFRLAERTIQHLWTSTEVQRGRESTSWKQRRIQTRKGCMLSVRGYNFRSSFDR